MQKKAETLSPVIVIVVAVIAAFTISYLFVY